MNNKQKIFKEKDIPYSLLEQIGITKMDILSLEKTSLQALLSGNRTGLMNIKGLDKKGEKFELKGRISLYRTSDDKVSLKIHPVRENIKNDIGLKDEEVEKIKKGNLIAKNIKGERYIVQLDKLTNELLRVKVKNIRIPSHIKDVELSLDQKNRLKKGESIIVESKNEKLQVNLDLNNPKGMTIENSKQAFEKKQKWDYDYYNPNIVGTIQTDRNMAEFEEYNKKEHQSNGHKIN